MIMHQRSRKMLFGVGMLFLAGCSATMAPEANDLSAKTFTAKPDKSTIYIYKNSKVVGSVGTIAVSLDGKVLGDLGGGTYLVTQVEPGDHEIASSVWLGKTVTAKVRTEAGRLYFVWMQMYYGGFDFHVVSDSVGRNAVAGCKEAQSNF